MDPRLRQHLAFSCVITLTLALGAGCGESVDSRPACVPGSTQGCYCPGLLSGVQICNVEGTGWGPCHCGGPPADGQAHPTDAGAADGQGAQPDGGGSGGKDGAPPAPDKGAPKPAAQPIMIAAGHYATYRTSLLGLRPLIVYGWAADPALQMYSKELQVLGAIKDTNVTKWLMFSSYKTASAKLGAAGHAAQLKQLGITGLGYNTEGDKTPSSEMNNLGSAVSQFAALAQKHGFDSVWGPIRATADKVSDTAVSQMIASGLDGIGLQEQKWIEAACPAQRAAAVKATSARMKKLAKGKPFAVQVQIMPSRCINGDAYGAKACGGSGKKFAHCVSFSDQIKQVVGSMAIWASSPLDNSNLVPLIKALRHTP
jgi:hypothetical protein